LRAIWRATRHFAFIIVGQSYDSPTYELSALIVETAEKVGREKGFMECQAQPEARSATLA
jgi:hypothetical protein